MLANGAVSSAGRPVLAINGRFLEQSVTGVQRVAREVTREIDGLLGAGEIDAEITLYHPYTADPAELELQHIRTRMVGKLRRAWWEQLELPKAIGRSPLLCLGNIAPVRSLYSRSRVGIMIHDLSYLHHPDAYRLNYRIAHRLMLPLLLARADRLFLVSNTERRRLLQRDPSIAPRLKVVPNGGWVERSGDSRARPDKQDELPAGYALYVGSLSRRKNFDRLLEAAIRLAREDGMPFVFVGSTGDVLKQPNTHVPSDVRDKLLFLGQVDSHARLSRLYSGARLLVFPSLYEASPLPPFEAAFFGCPVVASNIPPMWERCDEGVAYCDPYSTDSIVAAVRQTVADPVTTASRVAINRDRATRVSWRNQAREMVSAMLRAEAG